ncbi:MAG: formyltransferase family protein [Planctomycetota bacterium]
MTTNGQAFEYGVKVSGCTVHLLDDGMDTGPIVMQEAVSAAGVKTATELTDRILEAEHRLYPAAVTRLLDEPWRVEGRRVVFG